MATRSSPTKDAPAATAALPDLTPDELAAVARIDPMIPETRPLTNGEVGALGIEAIEGYFYGERLRFDSQGKRWEFVREAFNDGWRLTIRVTALGLVLAEAAMALDRLASKDGEHALIALVESLAPVADAKLAQYREAQAAMEPETSNATTVETDTALPVNDFMATATSEADANPDPAPDQPPPVADPESAPTPPVPAQDPVPEEEGA